MNLIEKAIDTIQGENWEAPQPEGKWVADAYRGDAGEALWANGELTSMHMCLQVIAYLAGEVSRLEQKCAVMDEYANPEANLR